MRGLVSVVVVAGCAGEPEAHVQAPPPSVTAAPEPVTSPMAPTWEEALRDLRASSPHSPEKGALQVVTDACASDCLAVVAAARDPARPLNQREAAWWGVVASDRAADPAVLAQAQQVLLDPTSPREVLRPVARVIAKAPDGEQQLSRVLASGEDVELRAAAGCGLMSILPMERWKEFRADDATVDRMGMCWDPWHYGQVESPRVFP